MMGGTTYELLILVALTWTLQLLYVYGNPHELLAHDDIRRIKDAQERNSDIIQQPLHNDSFIGFTAWKRSSQDYDEPDTIFFEAVMLDEGNNYQPTPSTFTCPHYGIYFVDVTLENDGTSDMEIKVVQELEGTIIDILYFYEDFGNNPYNTNTNSALVRCYPGEKIFVQAFEIGDVNGDESIPISLFTVMMMNQGDPLDSMHDSFIGFTAWKSRTQSYEPGEIIEFDSILLNEGSHYIPQLSTFRCPVNGTYFISVTFYKNANPLQLGVEKNTITILHVDDLRVENNENILTNRRLVRCLEGEQIMVKALGFGEVEGDTDRQYSTFSVMLMHQEGVRSSKHSSFVGFSAWKKTTQSYTVGDVIEFDGIMLNEGEHYDPSNNRFVCPLNAIYYVSVTFKRFLDEDILLDVTKQQTTLIFQVRDTDSSSPGNTVGNSALVRCFVGEDISIIAAGSGNVEGDPSQSFTTFTIMLMNELYE